jgi:hypothetical protein
MEAEIRAAVATLEPGKAAGFRALVTPKRYRWDLLYGAKLSQWVCDTLYPYGINDTHIDTALRQIVAKLDRETQ